MNMSTRQFTRNFRHRRKNRFELANENFEKQQLQSLTKAVNSVEIPVKQKHVRTLILGTFREYGAKTFWSISQRLPLLDNPIIAWKFCHTLHRILRDGHQQALEHSYRHKDILINMSQLWRHLHNGYGRLIELYCQLLVTKLTFHARNPKLPGTLIVSHKELESIYQKEPNNYFQISVEMFDYLDAILSLQTEIFNSLNATNSTSMTDASQCRLSPLIPCIQDASRLYDICVKVMFELHASIPADTLAGHRDRFLNQFNELKRFYNVISTMHYFNKLITVPNLPDKPPNFLEQIELKTYVSPKEVLIPSNDDKDTNSDTMFSETNLIDISTTTATNGHSAHQETLIEKDVLISHLQNQLSLAKMEHYKDKQNAEKLIQSLTLNVNDLKCQISDLESQLEEEKRSKEAIFQQVSQISQTNNLEKTKGEKFDKLKDVYFKLREEHIDLIRKHAEVEKNYIQSEKDKVTLNQEKNELLTKINNFMGEKRMHDDLKHDLDDLKISSNEEIDSLNGIIKYLEESNSQIFEENKQLVLKNQNLKKKFEELEQNSNSKLDEIENLTKDCAKYKEVFKSFLDEAEFLVRYTVEELENPALSAMTCSPDYLLSYSQFVQDFIDKFNEKSDNNSSIVYRLIYLLALHLIYTKATANTSPDLNVSDQIIALCKSLGANLLKLLTGMKTDSDFNTNTCMTGIGNDLNAIMDQAEKLQGVLKHSSLDILPELLENELQTMEQAIEQATKTIQDLMENSRRADSGKKLEVNAKILDKCQNLMDAIRKLIWAAKQLQNEIVSQGRGSSSVSEFYKKNHRWTDGLISAAKAVAVAANFFLSVADEIVNGKGKLEKLVVAAQEIVASSAQLVVASRVKADRNSDNLKELSNSSKLVSKATASIVATVKDCSQLINEAELDTSGLSLHETKRLEMESQVRVLELEKNLEQERLNLAALRRRHYQMDNI